MSAKLPVGETLTEVFQFALHRWSAVLRFGWLPVLLSLVVMLGFAIAVFDFSAFPQTDEQYESFEELPNVLRFSLPVVIGSGAIVFLLLGFLYSGVLASIYRLAALGEDRPGLAQLRMDGPAIRVFASFYIKGFVTSIIMWLAVTISLSLTGSSWGEAVSSVQRLFELMASTESSESMSPGEQEVFIITFKAYMYGWLIAAIPLLYVNVKLIPFAAGSAAENRVWLIGSFVKTTGHFWSIIGISILMVLMIMAIGIGFQLVMMIFQLLFVALLAQDSGFAILGGILALAFIPATIVYSAFVYALQFGAQGIIYRRLNTDT